MEREPAPAEKVLAGFMAAVCTAAVVGILTFGVAVGLSHLHPKLGVAYFAIVLGVLVFQRSFARRPWTQKLGDHFAQIFERAVISKDR